MPVYEVVLQQTYAGQQIINRWNYIGTGTPAAVTGSFALCAALGAIYDTAAVPPAYPPTKLMRLISAAQNTGVAFDLLSVKNIYSVTDFYESPFIQALNGVYASGEAMSPFMAYGMRTNRVRTDVRRATKRFTGCNEGSVGAQGALLPAFVTAQLNPIRAEMSAVLTYNDEGNTITFAPCVCGKQKYTPDPAKPEKVAYRYYATESEQVAKSAQGIIWDVYPQARSQTSRQVGRGR